LFLVVAAFFAVSSVFVSCNKDDSDPPTIDVTVMSGGSANPDNEFDAGTLVGNEFTATTVTVKITWKADGEISRIDLDAVSSAPLTDLTGTYPMTSGFKSKTEHSDEFKITYPSGKDPYKDDVTFEYTTKVADNNKGDEGTQTTDLLKITVKFKAIDAPTHPLEDPQTFQFKYATGSNVMSNTTLGITATYDANDLNNIKINLGGDFVKLEKNAYDAITTKEGLEEAYGATGANKVSSIAVIVDPNSRYAHQYFIAKKANSYFKVETTKGETTKDNQDRVTGRFVDIKYYQ